MKNVKAEPESPADQASYAKNELVLCYHQTSLYEAKVVNVDMTGHKEKPYFVHYNGWNSRWDEWVPADRIVKMNEDGMAKKRELDTKSKSSGKQPSKKAATKRESNESEDTQSKDGATLSRKNASSSNLQPQSGALFGVDDVTESSSTKPSSVIDDEEETHSVSSSAKQSKTSATLKKARASVVKAEKQNEKTESEADKSAAAAAATPAAVTASGSDKSKAARKRKSTESATVKEKEKGGQTAQGGAEAKACIDVRLSDTLKCWLVDDTDLITRLQKLTVVPARISVRDVLTRYVQFVRLNWNSSAGRAELLFDADLPAPLAERLAVSQALEFARGLVVFFNTVLGKQLLYKFERPQYSKILTTYPDAAGESATCSSQSRASTATQPDAKQPKRNASGSNTSKENDINQLWPGAANRRELADLYGCSHLIRLLSKLGTLLSASPFNATELATLSAHCQHFVTWLTAQLDRGDLCNLVTDYYVPPPEYQRHACC